MGDNTVALSVGREQSMDIKFAGCKLELTFNWLSRENYLVGWEGWRYKWKIVAWLNEELSYQSNIMTE